MVLLHDLMVIIEYTFLNLVDRIIRNYILLHEIDAQQRLKTHAIEIIIEFKFFWDMNLRIQQPYFYAYQTTFTTVI